MTPIDTEKTGPETEASEQHPEPEEQRRQVQAVRSECERELKVEVPAEVVAAETAKVAGKYQRLARIPGFRKGKVPSNLITRQFGSDIKQEVVETLIPRYFQEEAKRQKMAPISQPRITDLHAHEGEPLQFTAAFEVMPEVKLGDYRSHGIHKPIAVVTDEELNTELKELRERQAAYEPVNEERPLVDGDYAQVNFEGTPKQAEGEEAGAEEKHTKPAHMEDVLVEIGGANTVKEFNANLRGAKAGEERVFDVSYAEDFGEKKLAGQTVTYHVTVNAIKKKVVPELNDEFAKELGDFASFEDLKTKLREDMQRRKQEAADAEAKEKLIEYLVERNSFPVPEAFVDQQIDIRLERGLRALAQQGMRAEDLRKLDGPRLRAGQREQAIREVKSAMLLDKIADAENVQVTDEELANELDAVATHTGEDVHAMRARLEKDGSLDRIRDRMRNEKTLNHLLQT